MRDSLAQVRALINLRTTNEFAIPFMAGNRPARVLEQDLRSMPTGTALPGDDHMTLPSRPATSTEAAGPRLLHRLTASPHRAAWTLPEDLTASSGVARVEYDLEG
jgi:hypothetical protein